MNLSPKHLSFRRHSANYAACRHLAVQLVPSAARFMVAVACYGEADAGALSQQRPRTLGYGSEPLGPAGNRQGHLPAGLNKHREIVLFVFGIAGRAFAPRLPLYGECAGPFGRKRNLQRGISSSSRSLRVSGLRIGNPARLAHPAVNGEGDAVIPALDIDPFCQAFFDDPYPAHAAMRDAGPVVYLPAYDIHAVARYEDVRAMLLHKCQGCRAF